MTRWLAAPVLLALVLAGCGQDTSKRDCQIAKEVYAFFIQRPSSPEAYFEEQQYAGSVYRRVQNEDFAMLLFLISTASESTRESLISTFEQALPAIVEINCGL